MKRMWIKILCSRCKGLSGEEGRKKGYYLKRCPCCFGKGFEEKIFTVLDYIIGEEKGEK